MSTTVDNRVLEMRFDNKQFESGVATSMSTLDKLKQKLNLKGASKGLDELGSSAKKVDFSGMSNGIETVRAKFSALQVMGVTALANITNSAVNAGRRIVSALTIDPVKDGFAEYETQMNAVQTILANTQKEGTDVKKVNAALDELNTYADKTIYNFTEMTRNIGTFTAAGVKLDTSVNAIKGIANLAAVSGSTSQQASTAMYQLSQALAAGKVQLMDWNSVVNAGMGGQVFQDALIRTSENLKTGAKEAIKTEGSFRESLTKSGWLTTEVLTETLNQIAGAYSKADLIAQGYSEEQADEILKLAQTAEDAATKVKTFTQLIDTLKEALGSGWTNSWRLIIGDFEEAKELWTSVSDVLGGYINNSADARNKMLQEWADLGGRTAGIEAVKNAFNGLVSVVKPIHEAFRNIFPLMTGEQLYKITDAVRNLTSKFILSESSAEKLKQTFEGVFSIIDVGVDAVKTVGKGFFSVLGELTGFSGGILDATAAMGLGLSKFSEYIKKTDVFGTAVSKATNFLTNMIDKLKEFGSSIKDGFSSSGSNGLIDFLKGLLDVSKQVGSGVVNILSSIFDGIAKLFNSTNIFEVFNNGLLAGILIYISKFVNGISGAFDEGVGILENITGILDDVRGCFQAYQEQLKAGSLLKIAAAIGILAAALFVISTIDADALTRALGGITVLFAELVGSLALFDKLELKLKGVTKAIPLMIGMATAILILSGAMKRLASLDWEGIAKGLVGVGALMAEISIFLRTFKFSGKLAGVAIGIVILSSAMLILAKAVQNFGGMDWGVIGKGLTSIGILLGELVIFTRIAGNAKHMIAVGTGMVLLGASMKILASAVKDFSGMSWGEIGKGLTSMGIALAEVAAAMNLMPKSTIFIATGLVVAAAALKVLASSLSDFSGMSWSEMGRGLTAMGLALAELAIALNLMKGTLGGSAALLVAAAALAIITPVLKSLGEMSWGEIGKGLITLAGAFAVIGVAGALLGPVVPAILGLAAAFALLGLATLGIGAGLTLIATGITALASSLAIGTTAIVAGLTAVIVGIADLIPTIAKKIGEGVVEFAKVIGDCAPQLADALLKLISETLESLATYIPKISDSLFKLFIGVINSFAEHMPELITAAVNLVGKLLQGVVEALNGIDTTNLFKSIIAVGLITGLMYALSGVVALIPSAMAGIVGVGLVVAEMGVVLAAIGALAQIPGLSWLVEEGGNFLQKIGTAIGQFVGGIVGGVAKGATAALPDVANNLSGFMTNIQPFIEGAKKIDPSMLEGVKTLTDVILELTAADILNGLTSWLTGGSSLTDFADQLVPFGKSMKEYADSVSGIDTEAVTASANAAKSLAELANNLPNEGGFISLLAGDNKLSDFANQLKPFGDAMKAYSDSVNGISPEAVTASANAAKTLSELANNLPNSGGLVSFFTGDNSLASFGAQLPILGMSLKSYAKAIDGVDVSAVESSANAAKTLAELANNLPNTGGLASLIAGDNSLASFGAQLPQFGSYMKAYANSIIGVDISAVESSANAAKTLAELENNLPNTGGLASLLNGDNSLLSFGSQLPQFGSQIKAYADSIIGIDTEAVTASATAAKALVEVANALQNEGGLKSLFTGGSGFENFAAQLVPFGNGMKSYSDSVAGVNAEAMTNSASAAKALVDVANSLSKTGGLASIFTGETSLANLGDQLVPFGNGLRRYSASVTGIKIEPIINSVSAADALIKVANSLSKTGGLVSIFTGETSLANLGNQLVPFGNGLRRYGAAVTGVNTKAILSSASAAKALVNVANALNKSGGLTSIFTGSSNLASLGDQLVPFGNGLRRYGASVTGLNVNAITSSVTVATKVKNLINSLSGLNTSGVAGFKSAVDMLGKVNINGIAKAFSGSSSKMIDAGAKMINSLVNGIKGKGSAVTNALTSIVSKAHKTVTSKAQAFTSAGSALMTKLASGVSSKKGAVSTAVASTVSSAASRIRSQYSSFYSAGTYLGSGLVLGINSKKSAAYNAGYALGQAAVKGEKDGQKSHSPSKLTIQAGKWLGEGLVIGMQKMKTKVYNQGYSLGDEATKSMSRSISRIAELTSGDIDMSPTISPVLDLSDVKAGSSTLNSLFNSPSLGVSANVGAMTAMLRQNGQNGSTFEVVSAINKLRKDLGKVGNNTYNVNGVTYDDGSNIANAVEAIIRAARIERRS